MYGFSFSTEVLNELKKRKQKRPVLFRKIQKQLKIFKENSKHPSLRTHKLRGNLSDTWSISIEGNIRLIYTIKNKTAIFFKIGNHDEVYRK
jgi:addiction module RelE/StbE family toxin